MHIGNFLCIFYGQNIQSENLGLLGKFSLYFHVSLDGLCAIATFQSKECILNVWSSFNLGTIVWNWVILQKFSLSCVFSFSSYRTLYTVKYSFQLFKLVKNVYKILSGGDNEFELVLESDDGELFELGVGDRFTSRSSPFPVGRN